MKAFLNKYFEYLLILLTVLFLLIKHTMPSYGERISMIFFGSLSFYYLASGVLVFLDKNRIDRMMRLIYLFGLWSVSILIIAMMTRTLLLQFDKELLIVAISSGIGLMLLIWLYSNRISQDNKKAFWYQIQPLFIRSIFCTLLAVGFLVASNYTIYHLFGTYKTDPVYTRKIIQAYENPQDTLLVNDYKQYDASLRDAQAKPQSE